VLILFLLVKKPHAKSMSFQGQQTNCMSPWANDKESGRDFNSPAMYGGRIGLAHWKRLQPVDVSLTNERIWNHQRRLKDANGGKRGGDLDLWHNQTSTLWPQSLGWPKYPNPYRYPGVRNGQPGPSLRKNFRNSREFSFNSGAAPSNNPYSARYVTGDLRHAGQMVAYLDNFQAPPVEVATARHAASRGGSIRMKPRKRAARSGGLTNLAGIPDYNISTSGSLLQTWPGATKPLIPGNTGWAGSMQQPLLWKRSNQGSDWDRNFTHSAMGRWTASPYWFPTY
jgi:hypothetical protein